MNVLIHEAQSKKNGMGWNAMRQITAIVCLLCLLCGLILPARAAEDCTVTEGCVLPEGHEGECQVGSQPEDGDTPDTPCTRAEGCILSPGHDGECLVDAPREDVDAPDAPCTKTEGCILASGHDGECITADEEAPEESIPYSGLRFCFLTQEGQGESLSLDVGENFQCQLQYQGVDITDLNAIGFDSGKLDITLVENMFTIRALAAGYCEIRYTEDDCIIPVNIYQRTIQDVGVEDGLHFRRIDDKGQNVFFNRTDFSGSFSSQLYVVIDGTARLIQDGEGLTVTPDTGLQTSFDSGYFCMEAQKAGEYTITYGDGDNTYSAMARVTEIKPLYARLNGQGELLEALTVTEGEPVKVKFYYRNDAGVEVPIRGTVNTNDGTIQIVYDSETQLHTLTASGTGNVKHAIYTKDDLTIYRMPIYRQKAVRLAVDTGNGLRYDLVLDEGQETPVTFYFGEAENMQRYGGEIVCSEGLSLIQRDGKTYLSARTSGTYSVSTTVEGKTYTVPVEVVPALSGGSLFALTDGSSTPQFATSMGYGESVGLRLCYGSYGQYATLGLDDLTVSGNAATVGEDGQGTLILTGSGNGQTLLQYTDADDITHNYVVKCSNSSQNFAANSATVTLPYGAEELSVGFAWHTEDTMYMFPGTAVYLGEEEDTGIDDALCFGAMRMRGNDTVDGLANPGFYQSVSNVNLSIFSGTNPQNFQLGQRVNLTWQGVTFSQFSTHADKGANFNVLLLMTFDVQIEGKTCRFYRTAPFSYKTEPHDHVTVDIRDADVLNTILSDRDVLINYLEDNVEGFRYGGGSLTLTLPGVSYNKIIVCQIGPAGSDGYLATLTIRGTEGTTMPGLLSKGFLTGVEGIHFVSNGQTMPGRINCGVRVDNHTTYQPVFDLNTLMVYHPGFQGLTNNQAQEKYKSYAPGVPTTGNAYNMNEIRNCAFEGFRYAIYSGGGGMVRSGQGNTITNCDYGYYLNSTAPREYCREVEFQNNTFRDIRSAAVHIGSLPGDLSPYYIRFQNNKFYRTKKDFEVTSEGNYYFQRNYYDEADSHRSAIVTEENGAQVYTCPCRSQPDSISKLWIYEDQRTAIFQNQASEMTVDPACIPLLTRDVNVPILDEQEQRIAQWTITKKGGNVQ